MRENEPKAQDGKTDEIEEISVGNEAVWATRRSVAQTSVGPSVVGEITIKSARSSDINLEERSR